MNEPGGLCFNPEDNSIYVADTNNHCIRKIDLSANAVETVPNSFYLVFTLKRTRQLT